MKIPFNRPFLTGRELPYIAEAAALGHLSGDGTFSKRCSAWLKAHVGCHSAPLTHSCTAALEVAAILADVQPGEEVILPSFTFVSTANAFVLRGCVPVFVDVRPDTFNIDETQIEEAITERTRAIVVVHYAGVSCEMDEIMAIAAKNDLLVIEDAAQGVMSTYRDRQLGGIGHLGAFSFHETKNVICGEGGALLVNVPRFSERAEILREKGTNRSQYFRGQVDKYTWVDLGSSYLPSDMNAAFLLAQLEHAESITRRRLDVWNFYHESFADLEHEGIVRRPQSPPHCKHNAHMYYLLLPTLEARTEFIGLLNAEEIQAVFHYVPLHSSPMGRRVGRTVGEMTNTTSASERLVRLPLWIGLEPHLPRIATAVNRAARSIAGRLGNR